MRFAFSSIIGTQSMISQKKPYPQTRIPARVNKKARDQLIRSPKTTTNKEWHSRDNRSLKRWFKRIPYKNQILLPTSHSVAACSTVSATCSWAASNSLLRPPRWRSSTAWAATKPSPLRSSCVKEATPHETNPATATTCQLKLLDALNHW